MPVRGCRQKTRAWRHAPRRLGRSGSETTCEHVCAQVRCYRAQRSSPDLDKSNNRAKEDLEVHSAEGFESSQAAQVADGGPAESASPVLTRRKLRVLTFSRFTLRTTKLMREPQVGHTGSILFDITRHCAEVVGHIWSSRQATTSRDL